MLVVRATKKLLGRVGAPAVPVGEEGTTLLGPWYATALFWRPQVALLVNEQTLLPVLMPLAPAVTWPERIAAEVATVLAAHQVPSALVEEERQRMSACLFGATANRSVIGVMNEFTRLAETLRDGDRGLDLLGLALRLARTPCGPLYGTHISPDRALAAAFDSP
ncbi:hypothetical protein AB0H34_11070 [Saccharopolyspora shandongensis]|uniref:DUF6933 domain-containing protein n=1 Tax=Saccharopolyspora shandongensis TaxID=418495 RepID=UPI0033FC428F